MGKSTTPEASTTLPISKNGPEEIVEYTAKDSIELDNENQILYLYGEAQVTYGQMIINADRIQVYLDSNQVRAYGKLDSVGRMSEKVRFQDGEEFFLAPEMFYDFKTQKGRINDIYSEEGEMFLHAKKAKKMPNNDIYVKKGKITTCNHEDPHFYFEASKLKVIPGKLMVAGPTHLVIRDFHTPIWVPFGIFPNNSTKQSGIIIPSQGADNGQTGIKDLGYHWAINEYLHAEFLGSIYFGGTYRTNVSATYKKNYKFNGNLSFLHNNVITGTKGLSDYKVAKDYNLVWNHKQDSKAHPKSTFSVGINAKTASFNQTQILNHTNAASLVQGANTSQVRWDWRESWGSIAVNGNLNQNFTTAQTTIKAPSITVNKRNAKLIPSAKKGLLKDLQYRANLSIINSISGADSTFAEQWKDLMKNGAKGTVSLDFGSSYNIPLPILKYFKFTLPSITTNLYGNSKFITKAWNTDSARAEESIVKQLKGSYDLKFGNFGVTTKIYGMFTFKDSLYIKGFRHTITPSVNMSYAPNFFINSQDITRTYFDDEGNEVEYSIYENRNYSVHSPTAYESWRLNYSLRNNLQAKVRSGNDSTLNYKKVNVLNDLSLSGNYDFLAEEFKWSDVAINFNTNPGFLRNLNVSAVISPYALDSTGKVIDSLLWKEKKIGRLTNLSAGTNIAVKRKMFTQAEAESLKRNAFDWSLNLNYTFSYSNPGFAEASINNSIGVNGNVTLTKNWSFQYNIPVNIKSLSLSPASSINLTRQLHCWEMVINWLPFSEVANYTFTIRPKAGMLSDLKYEKVKR